MNNIISKKLIRDAGLLASAAAGILLLRKKIGKQIDATALEGHSSLINTPLTPIAIKICSIGDDVQKKAILAAMEDFLAHISSNDMSSGFMANRLANKIPEMAKSIVDRAKKSDDYEVAVAAIDFEEDELEVLGGICDDMVRNMLLDAVR